MEATAHVSQSDGGSDGNAHEYQPDTHARCEENLVYGFGFEGVCAAAVIRVCVWHQQFVCGESLEFDDRTFPSLVVIEQFSRLTRKRLAASTDPTSEVEIGVTVIDHGMYTLCCVRRRPVASTYVTEMMSPGALVPVTVYVTCTGPAGVVIDVVAGAAVAVDVGGTSVVVAGEGVTVTVLVSVDRGDSVVGGGGGGGATVVVVGSFWSVGRGAVVVVGLATTFPGLSRLTKIETDVTKATAATIAAIPTTQGQRGVPRSVLGSLTAT